MRIDRRRALAVLGGAGFGALLSACSGGSSNASRSSTSSRSVRSSRSTPSSSGSSAETSGGPQPDCVLATESTEGPFYLDLDAVRSDITEGADGAPLALALTIVDAAACTPIANAAVDIWHTDAAGIYSGVDGNDATFLRGTQVTGGDGRVEFATIYPGWYQGRAVHIHCKVHVGGNDVHTGQLYFPDDLTDDVFTRDPYVSRGAPDTRNDADGIYQGSNGAGSTLAPEASGDGYTAGITLGVNTA